MSYKKKKYVFLCMTLTVSESQIYVSKRKQSGGLLGIFFFFHFENEEMVFVDQAEMRKGTERKLNSLRSDPRQTFHTFAFLFLKFSTIIRRTRWIKYEWNGRERMSSSDMRKVYHGPHRDEKRSRRVFDSILDRLFSLLFSRSYSPRYKGPTQSLAFIHNRFEIEHNYVKKILKMWHAFKIYQLFYKNLSLVIFNKWFKSVAYFYI